ncbi:MAG: hypothetical protein ABF649_15230 [Bacillus sp. (in: firmicutes)]
MHLVTADIDEVLQTTAEIGKSRINWNIIIIEIDKLLEDTKNWN